MKKRSIILYTLSAALFISYVSVMIVGLDTSRATEAFNLYYVTREARHYVTQENLEGNYGADTVFFYNSNGNFLNEGIGWGDLEENATWILGNEASAFIYIDDLSHDYVFTINIQDEIGYANDLIVNGTDIGQLVFENNTASINVPANTLRVGLNRFLIRTNDDVLPINQVNPETEDGRPLNLFVTSFVLSTSDKRV